MSNTWANLAVGRISGILGAWTLACTPATAAGHGSVSETISVAGMPFELVLFGLTLVGLALFHHHTLQMALCGLAGITLYKLGSTGFADGTGLAGLALHMRREVVILSNLFLLLLGFTLLTRHFEKSRIPDELSRLLPDDWRGGLVLLAIVAVISTFLDNIAAALIGGSMAQQVFRGKVHIGYLAAIVAAANAGGCGSVIGTTTTTMMWVHGVSSLNVLKAFVAAAVALVACGIPAAIQQYRYAPTMKDAPASLRIEWVRVFIVVLILLAAILSNAVVHVYYPELLDTLPIIGLAVWAAILVAVPLRQPDWNVLPQACKGAIFVLSLVTCASMLPVETLPLASWQTALGLGFVSAVFDNIPLTALALRQGGYDWPYVAYAVGFGGSMIWFGSPAGIALIHMYAEAKSTRRWLIGAWHVTAAYVLGFFVMLAVLGWQPNRPA